MIKRGKNYRMINLQNEKFKRKVKELIPDEILDIAYQSEVSRELFRIICAFHAMSKKAGHDQKHDRQITYSIENHSQGVTTVFDIKASTYDFESKTEDFKNDH